MNHEENKGCELKKPEHCKWAHADGVCAMSTGARYAKRDVASGGRPRGSRIEAKYEKAFMDREVRTGGAG